MSKVFVKNSEFKSDQVQDSDHLSKSVDCCKKNITSALNYPDDESSEGDYFSEEENDGDNDEDVNAIGVMVRKSGLKDSPSCKQGEDSSRDVPINQTTDGSNEGGSPMHSTSGTPPPEINSSSGNDLDLIEDDLRPPPLDPKRRRRIPERPNQSLNLWSFMKNCIGKELTKIPMPVNFNEPLSMLQRITEDFEYAHLLHKAASIEDSCNQLVYIAAFCVSTYATTSNRTNKPFNPLLGETFECDRTTDLGWKSIAEQVSHHPPMLALHCEGKGWKYWCEFGLTSKFRGRYLQVNPIDINHLEFPGLGYHYTWHKVTTTVHNIIVGKLWIDNHGDIVIQNHKTGDKCCLKFSPYSYFSRDTPRKVTGKIINSEGETKWLIQGTWDNRIEAARVLSKRRSDKGKSIWETSTPKLVWQRVYPPPEFEKMYNMTLLAVQLNEPEDGVAPTDSRNRPDQRLMEEGKWDEANRVKGLLEEKQRANRRKRAQEAANNSDSDVNHSPAWFKLHTDPITSNPIHIYSDDYWKCKEKQDWSRCPEIFSYEKKTKTK